MHSTPLLGRRGLLKATAALAFSSSAWAQQGKRPPTVVQIADMSPGQVDVSRDFLVGSRAAWSEINARGGLRGRAIAHQSVEIDGSAGQLQAALDAIRNQPHVVALAGTVGDQLATQLLIQLRRELPDMPHIAPWLLNSRADLGDTTFPLFASRQEQISHAIKSLALMNITEIGVVYASPAQQAQYSGDMELSAAALKLRLKSYGPAADLREFGAKLRADAPFILIFLGGTPELYEFTQGLERQALHRYVIAMADVNLHTLRQMGQTRHASVIATQAVPLVNAGIPVVKSYRDALNRLYDEAPTPQSLSGYLSARYAFELLQSVDGPLSRASVLHACQRRGAIDLGGFRFAPGSRGYVTQGMLSADGRTIG